MVVWLAVGWLVALSAPATAIGAPATKALQYHGYRLVVPASWPVYRLRAGSTTCVRFNRHAVYLGEPSTHQGCPAHAAGRTEAILIEPLQAHASSAGGQVLPAPTAASASSARVVDATRGVIVTATWSGDPGIIERALGVRSLSALTAGEQREQPTARSASAAAGGASGGTAASGGGPASGGAGSTSPTVSEFASVYTGLGFDACSTPSPGQMAAWSASPYRALGVYIGGTNMACSQPNLTASWVSQQSADGWHLIPIYVGLQAPSNDCGCAAMSAGSAASQGGAAATDAIAKAQAIGLGPGNPVYVDMESYDRTAANSAVVLAFLASWTAHLHAGGYQSGVYGSAGSGIADLVSQVGTGYIEPDDIWIANWNGAETTSDASVPPADWASHQRVHQYDGAHNETYGGVTINIDGDYVDGAAATVGSIAAEVDTSPTLAVSPAANGAIDLYPSWSGASGISSWRVMAGATPASLAEISDPPATNAGAPITIDSGYSYFAVQAIGPAGQTLGSSPAVATPAHVAIFGRAAFVPAYGLAGVPVGCLTGAPCQLTTTVSAGKSTLVKTGPETIPIGGGLAYFGLRPAAREMLERAIDHRLAVQITVRDSSGRSASRQLNLIAFATSGPGPQRSISQSSTLRIIGGSAFVSNGQVGGILAACFGATPCHASTTISSHGTVIARAGPQALGVNELGYLLFTLTAGGHYLLAHAHGNQLAATVTIASAGATTTGRIALTSFS